MALYIPHSIFHLARLLYVRPETFGLYYVYLYCPNMSSWRGQVELYIFRRVRKIARSDSFRHICPSSWNISTPSGRINV